MLMLWNSSLLQFTSEWQIVSLIGQPIWLLLIHISSLQNVSIQSHLQNFISILLYCSLLQVIVCQYLLWKSTHHRVCVHSFLLHNPNIKAAYTPLQMQLTVESLLMSSQPTGNSQSLPVMAGFGAFLIFFSFSLLLKSTNCVLYDTKINVTLNMWFYSTLHEKFSGTYIEDKKCHCLNTFYKLLDIFFPG